MYCARTLGLGSSIGLSLILLFIGSDCLPVQKRSTLSDSSSSSQQPAWCRESRPRSSQKSPCNKNDQVRRYFLHDSKGCKIFGICPDDAAKYDNGSQYNYFHTFEDCQRDCMQHVSCPELTIGENVVVSDDGLHGWGNKMVFECVAGYSLSDNSNRNTRICQKNGTWSGATPVCLEQCQAPPPVRRAHIAPSKDQHNQGGNIHYTCEVGYELKGNAQRTCGPNGQWTGAEPSCGCQEQVSDTDVCTSCPEPRPIEHGEVFAPSRSLSAEIEYTCYTGFTLVGNPTRECGENGSWSGEEPTCWEMSIVEVGGNGEDITDTVVEVVAGSGGVAFTVLHSLPNPFKGTESEWTFTNGEKGPELPYAVKQSRLMLTFETILRSKEQGGNYSISFGNFTQSFQLDIIVNAEPNELPVVKPNVVFLNHMILPDDSAEFVCVMGGYPLPRIQWYRDNKLVTTDERTMVTNFDRTQQTKLSVSTLKIKNVIEEDSGSYWCTGESSAGNIASSVEMLEVAGSGDIQKRSVDDSVQPALCDSDNTVVLLGQVRAQGRQVRSTDGLEAYRVTVKRFLRGSYNSHRVRTVVVDAEPQTGTESRLRTDTDYILQGKIVDKTLFVSRHHVQRHTPELESHILSSSSLC